jgi:hypothetical protein
MKSGLTDYMCFHQGRNLIQGELCDIYLAYALFQGAGTMRDNLKDLIDKCLIRGNLCVPRVNKFSDYDGEYGVKLTVDVIGAREGR